jgi:hypothetical protein
LGALRAREGRKPFGHYDGKQIAVERMRALKNEGFGFDRIARQLNSEGIPTRTGQPWHGLVVNRIRRLIRCAREWRKEKWTLETKGPDALGS